MSENKKAKRRKLFTKDKLIVIGIVLSIAICGTCIVTDLYVKSKEADGKFSDDPAFKNFASKADTFNDIIVQAQNEIISDEILSEIDKESAQETEQKVALDMSKQYEKSTVVRVIDGDTYVVKIGRKEEEVRLIGVDTPESVAPADYSKSNTIEGKEVSEIVKEKIKEGDLLYLEYDITKIDNYGRVLAYAYFENGNMVQEWLLEKGYAQCMTVQPNSKYADNFAEIQQIAAENKIGLWDGFFESEE